MRVSGELDPTMPCVRSPAVRLVAQVRRQAESGKDGRQRKPESARLLTSPSAEQAALERLLELNPRYSQFLTWANNRCRSLGRQSGQSWWRRDQGTGAALRIPSQVSRNPLDSEAEAGPPARPSLALVLALKLAAQASRRYALAAMS